MAARPPSTTRQRRAPSQGASRRETDAPELVIAAPIRRPNAEAAAQILEALGVTAQAVDAGLDLREAHRARREERNASIATVDAATGHRDDELSRRSANYRSAYARERAITDGHDWTRQLSQDVETMLADNEDASPQDVAELIDERSAALLVDPATGRARDFGDPEARSYLARTVTTERARIMDATTNVIRDREHAGLARMNGSNAVFEQTEPQLANAAAFARAGAPEGLLIAGNIDLTNRPRVQNADGSVSTVLSMSIGTDEGEVLIPRVSDDGRILTEDEAEAQYRSTGRHLGVFRTPEAATAYAQALHDEQAAALAGGAGQSGIQSDQARNLAPIQSAAIPPTTIRGGDEAAAPSGEEITAALTAPRTAASAPAASPAPAPAGPVAGSHFRLISGPGARRPRADGTVDSHAGYDLAPDGDNHGWYPTQGFRIENPRTGHRTTRCPYDGGCQGNTADIVLADGTRVTVMHLAELPHEGQYEAGHLAAVAGNTGNAANTETHFHVEAVRNGRSIDPRSLFGAGTGGPKGSQAASAEQRGGPFTGTVQSPSADELPHTPIPRVNFEALMNRRPSGVDRQLWKRETLAGVLQAADERGDPSVLDNLWHSRRADGTPSFSPEEIAQIRESRDRIAERVRVRADRARAERYEGNEDQVLAQRAEGHPVSIPEIRQLLSQGHIRPGFADVMVRGIEEEARRDVSEQRAEQRADRAEQRELQREADSRAAATASMDSAAFERGAVSGVSEEEIERRWQRGDYGPPTSREGASRYRLVLSAYRQGGQAALQQPAAAGVMQRLESNFRPARPGSGQLLYQRSPTGQPRMTEERYMAAQARLRQLISGGTEPAQAYEEVVREYGSRDDNALREQLRLRRAQGGR
jgi:hypothetical protein